MFSTSPSTASRKFSFSSDSVEETDSKSDHSIITPITFLKKRQRKYIVATWLAVKDRTQFVLRIYKEVFRRKPGLQGSFTSLQCPSSVSDEAELDSYKHLLCQTSAFSTFLDYIVSFVHLDSGNFISDASFQIGRRHAERMDKVDCLPDDWCCVFIDSTLDCLSAYFPAAGRVPILKHLLHRSYRKAWEKLLKVVIDRMKEGFRAYRKEERQFGVSTAAISPFRAKWEKMAAMAVNGEHVQQNGDKSGYSSDSDERSN